jgi:hypothetical protein
MKLNRTTPLTLAGNRLLLKRLLRNACSKRWLATVEPRLWSGTGDRCIALY